eukprot:scaffold6925_cov180-Amphora_coffeaeformis.AAC.5
MRDDGEITNLFGIVNYSRRNDHIFFGRRGRKATGTRFKRPGGGRRRRRRSSKGCGPLYPGGRDTSHRRPNTPPQDVSYYS